MNDEQKPVGRPTKYSRKLAKAICDRIATTTLSNDAIAKEFGLGTDAIYSWKHRHKDFAEDYARAKESQQELGVDEIIAIADENPTCVIKGDDWEKECTDPAGIQRNRLRVDTRKWAMAHLAPKRFGDKVTATLEGDHQKPVAVKLSGDDLIARILGSKPSDDPKE